MSDMPTPLEPSVALQDGVEAALEAWAALKALMGGEVRQFDVPPTNAAWPHLVIGESLVTDDSAEGVAGWEARQPITVWTRPEGKLTARDGKRIAAQVVRSLQVGLALDGYDIVDFQHLTTETQVDPETQTVAVLVTLRLLIEPL